MSPPANSHQLYADLSAYYDRFCRDINYTQQCDYAQRLHAAFGRSGGNAYLDLACGTGQHLRQLAAAGFAVSGLDNSQAMLDQAAQRCPSAQLICADMANFNLPTQFDLISCFLYSVHYSHPVVRLQQVLQRAWTALKPGGVMVFDMVDKNGIENHAGVTTYLHEDNQQFEFSSRWFYPGQGELLQLFLSIKCQGPGIAQQWQDSHTMTAISIAEVQAYLVALGFEVWIMERDYERLQPWSGQTFNVIVVAVKADA